MSDSTSRRFSPVGFAIALVTVVVGATAGLTLGPVAGSSFLGMLLGGFLAGLALEERPLLEAGVAAVATNLGILVAGGTIGAGIVAGVAALGSIAPTTLLASIALSFAVGAFGAHFGNDLRDGLTEPVEEAPARARSATPHTSTAAEPATSRADDAVDHEPADENVAGREAAADDAGHETAEYGTRRDAGPSESRDDVELDRN